MAVTKIFRIELKNSKAVDKDIIALKESMRLLGQEAAKAKQALNDALSSGGSTKSVSDLQTKIASLESQLVSLNQTRNELTNTAQKESAVSDQLAKNKVKEAQAEKLLADAKLKTAQSEKIAIQSANERIKSDILQERELDRLIALEEKQRIVNAQPVAPSTIPLSTSNAANENAEAAADQNLAESKEILLQKEEKLAAARERLDALDRERAAQLADQKSKTEEIIPAVSNVTTKYEQYTGTLRANQIAQYENETALAANIAEQKLIQKEINSTGQATSAQTARMEVLREEEILLAETNKNLNVTIRNQAKEFLAAEGSLDEIQAQINQLQQAYQQLTATEKASPFGQGLKQEIDILEPKVKALEYELGIFGRNVGNYPQAYTKAFKVLETELDTVKGKLVKGNFTGKDFDDLAAKEKVLKSATDSLGASYSTTTARQTALKESARQLGLVYGTDSKVFKDFAVQVAAGNTELKKTDKALVAATGSGNALTKGLSSVFSALRNIAYAIPGIGLAGLIGLILTPLGALASKIFNLGDEATETKKKVEALGDTTIQTKDALKEYGETMEEITKGVHQDFKKEIDKLNEALGKTPTTLQKTIAYISILKDNLSFLKKGSESLDDVSFFKKLQLGLFNFNGIQKLATEQIKEQTEALKKEEEQARILAEAIQFLAQEELNRSRSQGVVSLLKTDQDANNRRLQLQKTSLGERLSLIENSYTLEKVILERIYQDELKAAGDNQGKIFAAESKHRDDKIKAERDYQDARANVIRDYRIRDEKAQSETNQRKLQSQINSDKKFIQNDNSTYEERLKASKDAYEKELLLNQEQKRHDLTTEGLTRKEINNIHSKYRAEDQKANEEYILRNQDIEKRNFERQAKDLKNALDERVAQIKASNADIQNDPTVSNVAKAQAQIDADNEILAAEQTYYEKLLTLNSTYNKDVLSQTREALTNLRKVIEANRKLLFEGQIKDIADASGKLSDEFKQRLAQGTINILTSDLSPRKQAAALLKLEQDAADALLANQVAALKREVDASKKALDEKLINEKTYQDKLAEYRAAEAKLIERNVDKELSLIQRIRNAFKDFGVSLKELVFGIRSYTDDAAGAAQKTRDAFADGLGGIKQAIATSYQLYFKSQNDAIEKQKEVALAFLDRQKANVLATAQSEAEKAAIERQFEIKRQKIEKEAAERKKKLALKEATINFAVAAIKTFATYGWPLGLIAVAGLTAAYLAERAAINQQQFAEGGKVQPRRISSGLIKHSGNIKPLYNGDNVLATVRTGEVVLNKRQQAALGGHRTFKAIGVPGFATGGVPGASLTAPTFTATSFNSRNIQDDSRLIRLEAMTEQLIGSVYATDQKEVVLVPKKVTQAQSKTRKDVSLATI